MNLAAFSCGENGLLTALNQDPEDPLMIIIIRDT